MKDIFYAMIGIIKVPLVIIRMIVAVPFMLLAFLVMVGSNKNYPFNNVFGRIVGRLLHGNNLESYYYND